MSVKHQTGQLAPALSTVYRNVQAGYDLTILPGLGLFYSEQRDDSHCPVVLSNFVRRLNAHPQLCVIVTVRNVGLASYACCSECVVSALQIVIASTSHSSWSIAHLACIICCLVLCVSLWPSTCIHAPQLHTAV